MSKRCEFLKYSTLDCIRCDGKNTNCPKNRNRNIVTEHCWRVGDKDKNNRS